MAYALYGPKNVRAENARSFVFSPVRFSVRDLDHLLPVAAAAAVATEYSRRPRRGGGPPVVDNSLSLGVDERTSRVHDQGGICTLIFFGSGAWVGQIWVPHWPRRDVAVRRPGTWRSVRRCRRCSSPMDAVALRLSAIPALLAQRAVDSPLPPPEIVLSPGAILPGRTVKAVVPVRNDTDAAVDNLLLEVTHTDGL